MKDIKQKQMNSNSICSDALSYLLVLIIGLSLAGFDNFKQTSWRSFSPLRSTCSALGGCTHSKQNETWTKFKFRCGFSCGHYSCNWWTHCQPCTIWWIIQISHPYTLSSHGYGTHLGRLSRFSSRYTLCVTLNILLLPTDELITLQECVQSTA